jgi:putative membrane protein
MNYLRYFLATALVLSSAPQLKAQADLNDLEMAHAAVTANNTDIAYAHLALALSENPAIREFAETMIRDHSAVNTQVFALARKLNVQAQDNAFSRKLRQDAARITDELSRLRGTEFDRFYASNELRYHQAVNGLVADAFIPNIENVEVKQAFQGALTIFRGHERHAERMVSQVVASR